jgi:hypothetical protein
MASEGKNRLKRAITKMVVAISLTGGYWMAPFEAIANGSPKTPVWP